MLKLFTRATQNRKNMQLIATICVINSMLLGMVAVPVVAFAAPQQASFANTAPQNASSVDVNIEASAERLPQSLLPPQLERAQAEPQESSLAAPMAASLSLTGQPAPIILGSNSITVTKSVVGSTQSDFSVNIVGPSYPSGAVMPITTGSQVITGLVSGVYTITEVSPGAGWTTTYTATTGYSTGSSAVVTLTNSNPVAPFASTQITGTVFSDYNSDGRITANGLITDTGVQSVTVTIYDSLGNSVSTGTDASGLYTVTPSFAGPYRVEFTNLPSDYEPSRVYTGIQNGTTVQFINSAAAASGVNLGLLIPCNYCQDNPSLALPLHKPGNSGASAFNIFSYEAVRTGNGSGIPQVLSATTGVENPVSLATPAQIGTTWGNAYQSNQKRLFVTSLLRRHAAMADGPGYVYIIDPVTGYLGKFNLAGVTPSNGGPALNFGSVTRVISTGADNDVSQQLNRDLDAFAKAGKMAFGDADYDENSDTLWAINLFERKLIAVNVSGATATLNGASAATLSPLVRAYSIPSLSGVPACTGGTLRPWGLGFYLGAGYLGVVCDASVSLDVANLDAYVLAFDPQNPTAGFTTALSFGLDYKRELVSAFSSNNGDFSTWRAWTDDWNSIKLTARPVPTQTVGTSQTSHHMPLVSDIDFRDDGSMVVGLLDRNGMMLAKDQYEPVAGSTTFTGIKHESAGDIILACYLNGTFVLEGTGGCAVNDNGTGTTIQGSYDIPQPTNVITDGPSNQGEFFYQDKWGSSNGHNENSLGSVTIWHGRNEVVGTVYDPLGFNPLITTNPFGLETNGIHHYNASTGQTNDGYLLVERRTAGDKIFSKAGALGDIEILCDPAPIEIGNRVWWDQDGDGVQDAGEPGMSGVQVTLQTPSGSINTTTDINGNYYFTREATTGAYSTTLRPNTAYTITIGTTPAGYSLTTPNAQALAGASVSSNHAISDVRDSDAALVSNVPTIYYTTGSAGQNNHGLDFGFSKPASGQVGITNTYTPPGTIQVSKQVTTTDGNVQSVAGNFTINVDCGGATVSPSNSGTVAAGSSITFSVAGGSLCTLSESTSNLPAAPSGYVWAAHQLTPNQVTVSSGVTSTVIARNTLAPLPSASGVLTLTKTISGTGTGPFTVTVSGPSGYLTTTTINGGQSKVITGLVSGIYTVTETSPGSGWTTIYTATTGYSTGSSGVVTLTSSITATTFAATQITGTVFSDYNSDGLITANGTVTDTGVQSVTVTIYDNLGNSVSTVTSASGRYTITPSFVGPYRVEFSNLPSGYEPTTHGTGNGTSTQFVTTAAGASNVNLGILEPCDYCQNDPNVAVTEMYFGAYTLTTQVGTAPAVALSGTLPLFPFNSTGTGTPPQNPATFGETGATYGLAWQRTSKTLFQAAYLKRHSGFGPGGSGAIYRTDSAGNTSLFIDINTIDFTGADPHTGQPTLRTDVNTFALVGKRSLGDIELSSDEQTLYVVNLNSQRLLALPIGTTPTAPTTAQVGQFAIPAPAGCIDPRPFAIGVKDATVYVGGVCSAESTQNRNDLSAYVYAFTPGATAISGSFGAAPVLTFNLTYARGWASLDNATCSGSGGSLFSGTNYYCPGEWRPYTNTWPINNPITPSLPIHSYPQPMLADIAFDNNGDMMLGLRDRFGDQTGPNATDLNGTPFADGPTTAGDLLRACVSGASWQIEQNANCGGITTSGIPANEGPTGTGADTVYEYYFGETYLDVGSNPEERHRETAQGGLVQIPGYLEVMAVVMNPPASTNGSATAAQFDWLGAQFQNEGTNANLNSGGVSRFRNRSGVISNDATNQVGTLVNQGYRLFKGGESAGLFAKTNGLGDVEALCDPAPIEIGNRVWNDIDGDGVQDAGEPGMAGVQVTLQTPSGSTINTTTDINGNYYFTREATTGSYSTTLRPNTNYTITINSIPSGYSLTTPNAQALAGASVSSNHAISDVRDSDAALVSNIPTIYYTTGSAGQNNHGLDFGFTKPATGIVGITNIAPVKLGNRLWIESDNDGNASTGTVTPVVGQVVTATDGTNIYTVTTDSSGLYTITVPANTTYTVTTGLPAGYLDTPTLGGSDGTNPTGNNDKNHDRTGTTVVMTTTDNLSIDFGFTPVLVKIGDRLWIESDNDGDASNGTVTPVVGQVVTATDGTKTYTATTDSNGLYTITVPANTTYTVTTGLPAGYLDTPTLGGSDGTNPTGNNDKNHDRTGTTVVMTETNNLSIDFGFTPILVKIGDRLWIEGDNDGIASTGTITPVVGQVVTATDGSKIYTATTDSNGLYTITVPANTTYTVTTGLPTGVQDTPIAGGSNGTNPSGNNDKNHDRAATTVVVTETDNLSIDFGFWQPLSLGNLVWLDTNNNGVVDGLEAGVEGVTVTLSFNGSVVATTTTDASGNYTFTNLVEGDYIVNIPAENFLPGAPLAGYISSSDPVSAADINGDDDDDDNGTGTLSAVSSPPVTLAPNGEPTSEDGDPTSNLTVDFGFYIPVSLGNRLFYDTNNDGLDNDGAGNADGSSVGIDGGVVELYRDTNGDGSFDAGDTLVATTTTSNGGYYAFTSLAPTTSPTSTYLVVITSSNFITGGSLVGYLSSEDLGTTLTPNGDLDFDDNGETIGTLGQAGGFVASRAISLTVNGEPTGENNGGNDPTDDNDSNQTVDFGFLRYDFGDLPDPDYPTLLANDGARHLIDPIANPIMGSTVDSEFDGHPSGGAGGDDGIDPFTDDEDGVTIPVLEPNTTVTISVVYSNPTGGPAFLNAWIDFNQDGVMSVAEQIAVDEAVAQGNGTLELPVLVPATAKPGDVFARFRLSTQSGLDVTGEAWDGEVEDYIALVPPVDLGDLPDVYGTSKSANGPRHIIDGVTRLDGSVDSEGDGAPGVNADGDDLATLNDEDGVQWPPVFLPNSSAQITVSVATTDSAFLNAWIDWNGDGDFNDALERIVVTDTEYVSGTHVINVSTPAFITDTLYARFRLTDNAGEATEPTGLAPSGEVEDYVLMSLGNTVWLDNGQGGGIADNGRLDGGEQGIANVAVELFRDGDDPSTATPVATTTTDADGHYIFNGLQPGDYFVHIPKENFDNPGDPLYAHLSSTDGESTLNPNNNNNENVDENGLDDTDPDLNGISSNLITLSIGDEPTDDGNGANGNLTLDFGFVPYDRGDLPNAYDTLRVDGGASHVVTPDLYFGATVDAEADGQPTDNADGDDTNGTPDDEDGILFMTPLMPNQNATISMTAHVTPGLTAYYGALIDFNGDGDFNDTGEIITGTVNDGVNTLNLTVPGVVSDTVYSRFRISTDPDVVAQAINVAPDGEVEDYVLMSLGNQLWFDNGTGTGNNGIFDAGEAPVPAGVTLNLVISGTTTPIATTTTDGNGNYLFTGLPEGDYQVIIAAENFQPGGLLAGYVGSSGQDSGDDTDDNDNGADVTSPALTGIPSNGVSLRLGDEPINDGNGALSNLTVDFGLYKLEVGNLVWNDLDNDGQVDSGEPVLPNVPVALLDNNGTVISTTTTNASGLYTFTGLISGTYVISVTPPAGYLSSTPTTTDDSGNNSDHGDASGNFMVSQPFDLTPGAGTGTNETNDLANGITYNPNLDFGLWQPLSLGNRVWFDTNNNGTMDGTEVGVAGVTLTLLDSSGNPVTSTVTGSPITALTDASGYYTFTDLISGTYQVQVDGDNFLAGAPLAGYVNSDFTEANPDANADEEDNGINPADLAAYLADGVVSGPILLSAGDEPTGEDHLGAIDNSTSSNYTVDFGFYKLSVGDLVWNDLNNNGVKDSTEVGLSNVDIALLDTAGNVISTTTTDSAGLYTFTGLISGTYVISVTPPANYVSSTDQEVTDGNNNSDHGAPSGDSIVSQPFGLTPGSEPTVDNPTGSTTNPNLDFGLWQPLELGNRVWNDANDNGDIESGEAGIANVTLSLLDNNNEPVFSTVTGLPITTTTDAGGYYTFTDLISGTYKVQIDAENFQPGGLLENYLSSTPTETNPDDDGDSNDNGLNPASAADYLNDGVVSGLVTLSAGAEPTNEADESSNGLADANSNLSVDFGFALWDRGDLPDAASATNSPAYSTTIADGGPSHLIIPGLGIGASEDGEADGQPTATANGDDSNGASADDEDGVTLPAFVAGQDAVVTVSLVNTTGVDAYVYGFIDFNGDGNFDNGETIVATVPGDGSVTSVALTFTVPVDADISQMLGARFRISSDDALDANGAAPDGEVEDYLIRVAQYDFGDLPSPLYPTLVVDNGASHAITPDLYFGASVDNEGNGQPNASADGDDINGTPDDEDGILFMTPLMPNEQAVISMTAYVTPGLSAYYAAFIDFNGDGTFDSSEIFTGTIIDGVNTLNLTVPAIVSDTVYSRFRISTDPVAVSIPTGAAPDGEVEDYALMSLGNQIWFDTGVGMADDGEFDLFEQRVPAGVTVTLKLNGTVVATTTTDAQGQYLFTGLPEGDYQVVIAPENFQAGGLLEGYLSSTGQDTDDAIDFNDNGDDATDPTVDGIPSDIVTLSLGEEPTDDGNGALSNLTIDFGLVAYDWGDLPDGNATNSPDYETLSNNNGAYHLLIDGLRIGATVDAEYNGQPTATADGDDSSGMATDDEDGVILPRFIPGQPATVVVNVTNETGETAYVSGFIDFNGNGLLDDAGEIAYGSIDGSGALLLTFNVPADADVTQWLGARFRLGLLDDGLASPTGLVYSGEVEDYLIQMQPILGAIGNYVWLDEDADGQQDAGEPGLANVIVTMIDDNGNTYTTTTDSQGGYLFDDLPKGLYAVAVAPENFDPGGALEGMEQTPLFGGDEDLGNKDETGYIIDLDWGEENLTADFGYNPLPSGDVNKGNGLAALGDHVWIDADGDGVQDPNEAPVADVVLTLYGDPDGDGIYDTVIATDTTDANGNYLFDDLLAGAYVVEVTDSSTASHNVLNTGAYTQTGDPDHFATTGTNNDNMSKPVILAPGDLFLNVDFGYQPQPAAGLNSVGDTIWFDADADGNGPSQPAVDGGAAVNQGAGTAADVTDYGIAGVTVALVKDTNGNGLFDVGEPIIASDVTDANGQYLFTGLADGKYVVMVTDTDNVLHALKPTWDKDSGLLSPDEMSAVDLDSANATAASVNDRLQDFGYTPEAQQPDTALLGDTIYFDPNKDGVQQPNESGIEGVLVVLTDSNGVTQTTTTDENGHYYFAGLDPNGVYTVTVAPENFDLGGVLEGMDNTGDPDGPKDSQSVVDFAAGTDGNADPDGIDNNLNLGQDFGYAGNPAGRIGNLVWLDSNADGLYDGVNGPDGIADTDDDEPVIAGVTIDLYRDLNGNGVIDAGEPKVASTVTADMVGVGTNGSDGNYIFENLPFGDYVVDVTDVDGVLAGYWKSDGPNDGSNNNSQIDAYAVNINPERREDLTADFGYYVEPAAVGNYVWIDSNANGIQDDGETGINGVKVKLAIQYPAAETTVYVTVVTANDADGNPGWYSFDNLLIDEDHNGSDVQGAPVHTISVDLNQLALAGYSETIVDQGDDKLDSDEHAGVLAEPVQGLTDTSAQDPASNEGTIASYDFGYYIPASLGNYVWLDENADGVQDEGEPGLPNVIVVATNDKGDVFTTTTDSHGGYLFSDLIPGLYTVTIPAVNFEPGGALEGMEQTPITDGNDSPDLGNKDDAGYVVELSSGEENLTADFGYNPLPSNDVNNGTGLAALGDRVWIDSDGDGVQDPNETPVSGVVLTLYSDPDGDGLYDTPLATDTTDANGNYHFADLPAGSYVVKVTDDTGASHDILNPANYSQTGDPDHFGTTGTDNDNMSTTPVVLAPGDLFLNVDFGYQPQSAAGLNSVGDTIWFDADADGNGPSQPAVDGGAAVTQGAGGTADATDYGIAGVTVALVKDINGNGLFDVGEPIIATDVTDGSGQYLFEDLADGNYLVIVTDTDNVLAGLKPTFDQDNGTAAPDEMSAVDLDSAQASSTSIDDRLQDFGYTPEAQNGEAGLIGDTIWFDSNKDGVQNPTESGIEGVVVQLTDMAGNLLATTTTDENGHYYFADLPLNEQYKVVVAPENFAPGGVLEGMANTGDKEGDKNNTTTSDVLSSATPIDLTNDLGYAADPRNPVGRVGNLVWLDSNADGNWDGVNGPDGLAGTDDDEPLIGGVTLDLYRDLNGNGKIDAGEPKIGSTTTTSTPVSTSGDLGNYLFDNLPVVGNGDGDSAAEYVVDVTDVNGVLAGYWHSLGTPNVTNNSQSDADAVEISIAQPENLTADFGYYVEPAAVGNYVWVDTNGDGIQNDGETGINGVAVTLNIAYPNGTIITVTTVTTDDLSGNPGYYSFGNLLIDEDHNGDGVGSEPVHTISVALNQPALAGYVPTVINVGSDDKLDSDDHAGVLAQPVQGLTDTSAKEPANSEQTIASYDFGFYQPASLGDYVWEDLNKDGIQDEGEPGVAGVTVELLNSTGTVISTTVTDASGIYTFSNLAPGSYSVKFTAPDGYLLTSPNQGDDVADSDANRNTGITLPVTLVSGEHNPTLDAGIYSSLSLGNLVWHDANNNGAVDNGESGIAGVTLQLFQEGDDPTTATPLKTTATDVNGNYLFTDLLPGKYFVYIPTPPVKYPASSTPTDTADNGENNDDNGSQPTFGAAVTSPVIDLRTNSEPDSGIDGDGKNGDLTIDFGFFAPASLGDLVWFDSDKDGVQDSLETGKPGSTDAIGVAGVLVTLFKADGSQVATTTTDIHGNYLFDGLVPGDYYVEFAPPAGYKISPTDTVTGTDVYDSDGLRTPVTNLSSGEHDPTLDLGLYLDTLPASIGDYVWLDANNNGLQDSGETGIPGVKVTLYHADGTAVASTTTDTNGKYFFAGLIPGDYYVQFTAAAGLTPSPMNAGSDDAIDSDANTTTGKTAVTTLDPGENDPTWDAGFFSPTPLASIGDYVWYDLDADGIQDTGETGVPGVVVKLYDGEGNLVATTTTDGTGHYGFQNLVPGDYSLAFEPPAKYFISDANQGSNDGADSDVNPITGRTPVTTLVAGENDPSWDLGIYAGTVRGVSELPVSLGDRVWNDLDRDGIQDADEPGMPGVTVKLYDSQGQLIAIMLTGANGEYSFNNLPAGDYYVEFVPPSTYLYSPTDAGGNEVADNDMDHGTGRTPITNLPPGTNNPNLDAGFYLPPTADDDVNEPDVFEKIFLPIVSR